MSNSTITVRLKINDEEIASKITNDRFGTFTANEWKRLIDPYTPRDTGTLMTTAQIRPWEIHYAQPYASAVYYGYDMNFQKINPYSTYEWDTAAQSAGQADKLTRILNSALKSGQF